MDTFNSYLEDVKKYDILTKAEEQDLFKKAKAGDRAAYEKFINSNLRFVISVAKKYQNQGIPLQDLIAEGNIGLIKAYEKFDPSRNLKFITYAVWWIKQSITSSIYEHAKTIRLPLNKISDILKLHKLKNNIEQQEAREISFEELRDFVEDPGMSNSLQYQYSMVNIDKPCTDDDKDLNEVIPDLAITDEILKDDIKAEFLSLIEKFSKREQDILCMYYGINYPRTYTLKEIGIKMKLTRERIRQIKAHSLEKLKNKKEIINLLD